MGGGYSCVEDSMCFNCQSPPTHIAEEGTRKRSGSSQKHIGLEVTYKAGGGEHKLSLLPAPSHSRKQATEWLRALKKVREY